jgi:hypothetical protein
MLELLLVLDNCEHVIDVCAPVVEEMLERCSKLRLLATSREPRRITGETAWRVPSLALPGEETDPEALRRTPALELFVERAQAAASDLSWTHSALTVVGRICTRRRSLNMTPRRQVVPRVSSAFTFRTANLRCARCTRRFAQPEALGAIELVDVTLLN